MQGLSIILNSLFGLQAILILVSLSERNPIEIKEFSKSMITSFLNFVVAFAIKNIGGHQATLRVSMLSHSKSLYYVNFIGIH